MPTDDELAKTTPVLGGSDGELDRTIPTIATNPPEAEPELSRLGRFQVLGVLGIGGMGVVHTARDPELDRRVALKVLHPGPTDDARARLMREARAMAKLSHPNVVTVYEVGTDDDRDFIAMELIDGGDLAQWIARRPSTRDVLHAFIRAGRGLAAAHAAGIVHRDFKPSNVLRRSDGHVVVTDFGLAYEGSAPASRYSRAVLAKTLTGAVMGTPAYMAPEQWLAQPVTAASDQFAFAAALWEGLAGTRAFDGETVEQVREQILRGPGTLDDGKIPRNLRAILRRGLALDPAQRWPSMVALLRELERVFYRRRRWLIAGAAMTALAAIAVAAVIARDTAPGGCGAPALDPSMVAGRVQGKPALGAALAHWTDTRGEACNAPPAQRAQQLACLDGVLARIADVATGTTDDGDALVAELIEPELCRRTAPPKLTTRIDGDLATAFAALRSTELDQPIGDLSRPLAASDPCARAVAMIAELDAEPENDPATLSTHVRLGDALAPAADRCADDEIKTAAVLRLATGELSMLPRAEAAVDAFPSASARATLDALRSFEQISARQPEQGLADAEKALAAFEQLHADRAVLENAGAIAALLLDRGTPADLATVVAMPARWPNAVATQRKVGRALVAQAGVARWRSGDVAGGDAAMPSDWRALHSDFVPRHRYEAAPELDITGVVVDEAGNPTAGAEVAAAVSLQADSAHVVASAIGAGGAIAITDATGRFALPHVRGFVTAKVGALRSSPMPIAATVRIVVHPTSQLEGAVVLGATPPGQVVVAVRPPAFARIQFYAPVRSDGTFDIEGIPFGDVELAALSVDDAWRAGDAPWDDPAFVALTIAGPRVTGIKLDHNGQSLTVIGRSAADAAPEDAIVYVFKGAHAFDHPTLGQVMADAGKFATMGMADPAGPTAKPPLAADDLVAVIKSRPRGELTVCILGLSERVLATVGNAKVEDVLRDSEAGCAVIGPDATTVSLEIPAIRRVR